MDKRPLRPLRPLELAMLAMAGLVAAASLPAFAQVPGFDPYYVQKLDPLYGMESVDKAEFLNRMGMLYDMNMERMKKAKATSMMRGDGMARESVRAMLQDYASNAFGYDPYYVLNPAGRTVAQTGAKASDALGFDPWSGMDSITRAQFLDGMGRLYDRKIEAAKKAGTSAMMKGDSMTRQGVGTMIQEYLSGNIPGA